MNKIPKPYLQKMRQCVTTVGRITQSRWHRAISGGGEWTVLDKPISRSGAKLVSKLSGAGAVQFRSPLFGALLTAIAAARLQPDKVLPYSLIVAPADPALPSFG